MNKILLFAAAILTVLAAGCKKNEGASPYDPNTPITKAILPKVKTFLPKIAKKGDTVTITGYNFTTASAVNFGAKPATSFKIVSDTLIKAIVGDGTSGTVSVTNDKGTKALAGFIFQVPVDNGNLALNKPATGSTNFNDPALTVDGNPGSFWQPKERENQWLKVDLQASKNVNHVFISWDGAYATDFAIQVSTDDVTYTTIYSENAAKGGDVNYTFRAVAARYFKILLNKDVSDVYPIGIHELEVYSDTNLALNKPASALKSINDPARAVDGDYLTLWQAGGLSDQWYTVNLGSSQTVGNVKITWDPGAYATDYAIQLSPDNVNFKTVYSTTTGPGGSESLSFTPAAAQYVRILLNKSSSIYYISMYEFEVYAK